MGEFGWAYISGSATAEGIDGSLQTKDGVNFSGSASLVFDSDNNLKATGSVLVNGNISASAEISASAYYGDGSNLTGIVSSPAGSDHEVQFNDNGSFGGSSNLTFDGSTVNLTGTLNVSGTVNANEYNVTVTNQNVINLTATGSTKFGDTSDDIHQFSGSVNISGGMNIIGLSDTGAVSTKYLALDANDNLVLTSSSGGSGGGGGGSITVSSGSTSVAAVSTIKFDRGLLINDEGSNVVAVSASIGEAEDAGGYDDGLFTDFSPSTAIGIPIDRFNEVLKILAPTPAPNVQSINEDVTDGVTAKLSFGASFPVADYTSSATDAGFTAVDRSGSYGVATSGNNLRLGVYDGTQDITGFVNHDVVQSVQNGYYAYTNDAFGNANEGTLKLELNGTIIHSVELSGLTGTGNPTSGTGTSLTGDSGFTNVSVTASSFDGNNSEWYIFKYRTAKYKIDANDQKVGWNYIRVIHSLTSDNTTNYIEWINDPSGAVNDLSVSNARIENVTLVGSKYLSGVQYNTDATANYKVDINNLYRNVYQASGNPITFSTTNSSTPAAQSVPDITVSENNTKVLSITGSLDFNQTTLFDATMSCDISVSHPLKNTISNTGSAEANGFLIDTRTLASTNLEEFFHDESFRKTSGSYETQNSVLAAASMWDSENHMTGGGAVGHTDGLLFHNQRLYSPVDADIPNDGDFSSISNVESGQPDYSSIVGTRTFYRVVSNSSGVAKRDMKIVSTKNSTTYNNSTLGASNVHFFAKIPGSTGWMDISQNFSYGNTSDNDGALISGASNDVDSGNNTHHITFGTQSVDNGDHVMIKILADESWGGYISELSFSVGATTNTATNTGIELDNIDLDDTAGINARLSFGENNTLSDYTNVSGSGTGSLSSFDINSLYNDQGTTRRGVFDAFENMGGTLNENISSNGNNYPANSFKDAYTGSLVLEVNGVEVHEVSLTGTINAITNDFNGNSSGFSVSALDFSTTSDNIPDYTKPYRTGTYQIGTSDQNVGWNYARVLHRFGGSDVDTNYVEWVVDPSGSTNDTVVSTPVLGNFDHSDVYYQSGIGYFASRPSASFEYTASNFYRNVYQDGTAISFPTTTNSSISNIRISGSGITTFDSAVSSCNMPLLNSSSNCHLTDIHITGTVLFDSLTSISGAYGSNSFTHYDITVDSRVLHPFKTDRTTSQASKSSFMVYSGSIGSTTLADQEYFNTETYRIVSGNYTTQGAVTNASNAWNSQRSMNDGASYPEYNDGMVTVNGFLISPFSIGNLGDTRNVSDGGDLQAPSGNPDYSTSELSESVRTYYRYFRNTGVTTVQNFNIYVEGDASIVAKQGSVHYGALGSNNRINIEMKVPGQTAWGDVAIPQGGVDPTSDGDGIFNGGNGNLDQDASNGSNVAITLGTLFWDVNDYIVLKISAHKDWTGYLTEITASY